MSQIIDCLCALKVIQKMFDQQTAGGQEVMNVVTEVLEKVVGINWRALVIPSVAFASSSQSF